MKSESHVGSCASAPAQLAEPGRAWWSLVEPGGAIVPRWRLAPVMALAVEQSETACHGMHEEGIYMH